MKNIKIVFWGFFMAMSGLWLLADPVFSTPFEFFALRSSLINYTGIIGIGVMSVAMILAIRPVFFEPWLGGLDKMYRLHKWLGITGLVFAVTHWLWTQAPKWLVGLGWIERPARHGASAQHPDGVFHFFQSQRGLAEGIGEWAFYAAVVLIVLALMKRFPYRYFFKTHRLLAVTYLFLVFHSLVLMKFSYWGEIIAPVVIVLMFLGSVAALGILLMRAGHNRRLVGLIDQVIYHRDVRVVEAVILIKGRWSGHQAGQFAFVTFEEHEGAHPFTITSAWNGDGYMRFAIKELGDYTRTLPATLKAGNLVKVEGPYGQFNFIGNKPHQIWVGGGIGITPFISRMERLAKRSDGKIIDLFYTTKVPDDEFIGNLQRAAHAAKIQLHVLVDAKDGLLNAERICRAVPKWKSSDIWFCGPAGFGKNLRRDFCAWGLNPDDFHQEFFELR